MRNSTSWFLERKTVKLKGHCMRKGCTCGGHNDRNVKKNLHHHSTATRFLRRMTRRALRSL